jgi:hypothetical protein
MSMRLEYVVPRDDGRDRAEELEVTSVTELDEILDLEHTLASSKGWPIAVHLFSGSDTKHTLIFTIGAGEGFARWWGEDMFDSCGEQTEDAPLWEYSYNGTSAEIERTKLIPQEQVRATARAFFTSGGERPATIQRDETK